MQTGVRAAESEDIVWDTNMSLLESLEVLKPQADTAATRKAVRLLAKTIIEKNASAKNETLRQLAEALNVFANDPIFRGDRYKLEVMKAMSANDRVDAFNELNKSLRSDDETLWDKYTKDSPVFEYMYEIVYEFNDEYDIEQETIFTILDDLKTKGVDAIAAPKDMFEDDIEYGADSVRMKFKTQTVYLTNNAYVIFGEKDLKAGQIEIAWVSSTVKAYGIKDSTGAVTQKPVFKEGGKNYNANEMLFNFQTNKGVIKGIVTEEGDGIIQSKVIKKTPKEAIFMYRNIYTTCNLEHPHYGIRSRKLKVVPKKSIVTGPFIFELNNVPIPIGLPFGMFPSTQKRSSGLIMPSYGEEQRRGFFLRDGGVYLSISDYLGTRITGSIYSLGSWDVAMQNTYRKRYGFSGTLGFNFANNKIRENDGSESQVQDYKLNWSHSQESKGSSRFSASVNLSSSTYNANNSNNYNDYIKPSTNSNVRYSNNFNIGNVTLSASAALRHNQNFSTGEARLNPDVSLAMSRVRPLAKFFKGSKNILSEINFSYTGKFTGEINNSEPPANGGFPFPLAQVEETPSDISTSSTDEDERLPDLFANFSTYAKDFKYGITHSIPVSTNFSVLKYFTITPSFNYTEYWLPKKYDYTWNDALEGVVVDTLSSFARYYDFSTNASLSTNMYMFYDMVGGSRIRQTIRPSVSYSFRPDFGTPEFDFYQYVQTDENGTSQNVFRSHGGFGGRPSTGRSSSIGFGVTNQFELKKGKKDEDGKSQKVMLLDNLSIRSSYDFERDSLNLADFSVSARTRLFDKVDINVTGKFDPYTYVPTKFGIDEETGETIVVSDVKTNDYLWATEGRLADLQSLNVAISTRLAPKKAKERSKKKLDNIEPKNETEEAILEDMRRNPQDYIDFDMPWSLSVNYSLSYSQPGLRQSSITQAVQLRGDVSLTPKWKVNFNTGYDIEQEAFTTTRIQLSRDLHCWQMSLDWVPFGVRQSYSINISVKSSLLQDLKWQRRNSWQDNTGFVQ